MKVRIFLLLSTFSGSSRNLMLKVALVCDSDVIDSLAARCPVGQ